MAKETAAQITRHVLDELIGPTLPTVAVRLWDGSLWPDPSPRPATLALKHPGASRAMFLAGNEAALAEAYLYDDLDIEGDIEAAHDLAEALLKKVARLSDRLRLALVLLRLPAGRAPHGGRGPARLTGRRHSIERDRQAISYHYDISNDFYRLFLDQRMVYSCAYFADEAESLDAAQERKLDYICRKLRLRPGQRLLDIGCGWGGLAMHVAQHYGADVTGITLSEPQAKLANERIAAVGLDARCRVLVQDYREVEGVYDALVSVGMFEHVGEALLPEYFERARALLRPKGVFLNHGIARNALAPREGRRSFSNAYVFPDGELTPISATLRVAEACGFEVRDVESLREHYALTLRHWVRRLEANHVQALRYVKEPTYRVWRLFMSASAHGFASGQLNVYQTLLVKRGDRGESGLPLQRADWYTA
jgi:cyclopropane-fatty-acyl-phospholipid synthase